MIGVSYLTNRLAAFL